MSKTEKRCGMYAAVRYTWPGKEESFACPIHAQGIANVSAAIGLPLSMPPIDLKSYDSENEIPRCQSVVTGE